MRRGRVVGVDRESEGVIEGRTGEGRVVRSAKEEKRQG